MAALDQAPQSPQGEPREMYDRSVYFSADPGNVEQNSSSSTMSKTEAIRMMILDCAVN